MASSLRRRRCESDSYEQLNVVTEVLRRDSHASRVGETRSAYIIFYQKLLGSSPSLIEGCVNVIVNIKLS
jgi:hypothetical protein